MGCPTSTPVQWPGVVDDTVSIAAIEVDGAWRVITSDADSAVVTYTLDGQPPQRQSPGGVIRRIQLDDLDGDGELDLHTLGDAVQVAWSLGRALESWQTLLPSADLCLQPLSSISADLDGDGDREIILPTGTGCLKTPAAEIARNDGAAGFSLETVAAEADFWGATFSPLVFDADGDHDPDVYLCNEFGPETAGNGLLVNDGAGGLSPGDARGAEVVTYCMSVSAGDLNSDGLLDLYIAALSEQLALTDSEAGYIDQAAAWGLPGFSGEQMPWGSALADSDNDGLTDIILATGDFLGDDGDGEWPMLRFHQRAPGEWVEDGADIGLPTAASTRAVLTVDLNGDGVLDILASDTDRPPHVLLSAGCTAAGWLEVAVPEGTRVEVEVDGTRQVALATAHPGFSASGPAVAHFGLGDASSADRVRAWVPWVGEVVLEGPILANQVISWTPDAR
jgi:hypothetical protein